MRIIFDRSSGALELLDTDDIRKYRRFDNIFSGGGNPDQRANINRYVPNNPKYEWFKDIGSIPGGNYEILHHDKKNYYRLDPLDSSPRNDRDDRQKDTGGNFRDGYRLHPGGTSLGCVTVGGNWGSYKNPPKKWYEIQGFINQTKTSVVNNEQGLSNKLRSILYNRSRTDNGLDPSVGIPNPITKYGILIVK